MRLTVFGATGGTGRELVRQALAAGHTVTGFARDPAALGIRHERLVVAAGDVLDRATVAGPVAGADAVVSALGIGHSRAATTVYSRGTRNVLGAMREHGVRRLVCVSTSGIEVSPDSSRAHRAVTRLVLQRLLRRPYQDMELMEGEVRGSGLDWTVVRAPRLTNGPRTGSVRTAIGTRLVNGWSVSRGDLAGYILCSVNNPEFHGKIVEIAACPGRDHRPDRRPKYRETIR